MGSQLFSSCIEFPLRILTFIALMCSILHDQRVNILEKKMRLVTFMLLTFFVGSAFAEAKIIECEHENIMVSNLGGGEKESWSGAWEGVFDTDDFKKEDPTYEYTKTKWLRPNSDGLLDVGEVFRNRMEVSPTTISFYYCWTTHHRDCEGQTRVRNVSRKTLTYEQRITGKWFPSVETGKCTVKDYNPGNLI